jgi:hypothetical protein
MERRQHGGEDGAGACGDRRDEREEKDEATTPGVRRWGGLTTGKTHG